MLTYVAVEKKEEEGSEAARSESVNDESNQQDL